MIPWVIEFSLSSAADRQGPSGLGIIWLLARVTEAMEVPKLVSVIQKISSVSRSSGTLWAWTQTWQNITSTALHPLKQACTLIQAQLGGVVGAYCRGGRIAAIFAGSLPSDRDKCPGVFPRRQRWKNRMNSVSWSSFWELLFSIQGYLSGG